MYDTSRDPCLLVCQIACSTLARSLAQKSSARVRVPKKDLAEHSGKVESAVMTLLYTYQEPRQLAESEAMTVLTESAARLAELLEPVTASPDTPPLVRANVQWAMRTFGGLPGRIGRAEGSLASGVDLVALEVRNISTVGSGLWRTRSTDGKDGYTVMTNLTGLRQGDVLGAAFLPPREVGGEVSEAMFLGAEKRAEEPGSWLSVRIVDAREVVSILHDQISR